MNSVMDILFARRPCINYVSPAICEGDITSGSGFGLPSIVLEPFGGFPPVVGMTIAGDFPGPFSLSWEASPGAICYNVYRMEDGELVLIFECVQAPGGGGGGGGGGGDPIILPPGGNPDGGDVIVVTIVTPDGEGPPSHTITTPTNPSGGGGGFWNLSWLTTFFIPGDPVGSFVDVHQINGFEYDSSQPEKAAAIGSPQSATKITEGVMLYTGPARSSHIKLVATGRFGNPEVENIAIEHDGNLIMTIPTSGLSIPNGVYDFDFVIPESVNQQIKVTVFRGMGWGAGTEACHSHWVVTLT